MRNPAIRVHYPLQNDRYQGQRLRSTATIKVVHQPNPLEEKPITKASFVAATKFAGAAAVPIAIDAPAAARQCTNSRLYARKSQFRDRCP